MRVKNLIKNIEKAISASDKEKANELFKKLQKTIDDAVKVLEKVTTEKEAANVINAVQFNIQAAPRVLDDPSNPQIDSDAPIIIEDVDIEENKQNMLNEKTKSTGLDFVLNYQSIDNYKK